MGFRQLPESSKLSGILEITMAKAEGIAILRQKGEEMEMEDGGLKAFA